MTMKKPTKKAVKELVTVRTVQAGVPCDSVVAKKNGLYSVRRCYFYRHGMNPVLLSELYAKALPEMEVVSCSDHFNHWPKDSFFEVVMKVRE